MLLLMNVPRYATARIRRWAEKRPFETKRIQLVLIAIVCGVGSAAIELPLPAEDALRAVRAELRSKPASGDIAVIAIDDASLDELRVDQVNRSQDASVLDNLFGFGAERVFFDKAYADPTNAQDDAAFEQALKRHRGKVWLGLSVPEENGLYSKGAWVPMTSLRAQAEVALMNGMSSPFKLAVFFPTESRWDGNQIGSISAAMAKFHGDAGWYRIDRSIDPETVPTFSYADVLRGRLAPHELAGKTVIVGSTNTRSGDMHPLPLGGQIPGVYFHAIGAETLLAGKPSELGPYIPLALALIVLCIQAAIVRPSKKLAAGSVILMLIVPTATESIGMHIDVLSAVLAISIGTVLLSRHASKIYTPSTRLLLPQAAIPKEQDGEFDVYALKINNLADMPGVINAAGLAELVERIAESIAKIGVPSVLGGRVGFENDTLIWSARKSPNNELEGHAAGLLAILSNAANVRLSKRRLELSFGIDTNDNETSAQRIANAVQAANLAGRRGEKVCLSDARFVEEKQRRIALLDALDPAMAIGSIAIHYQPKRCLKTGAIKGAEALLRWSDNKVGEVNPEEIVRVAEDHDRIDELTGYVVNRVLEETRQLVELSPRFTIAINVSAVNLRSPKIVYEIVKHATRSRFPLENLIIEVTESSKLDDIKVLETISMLQEKGVTFSIDDFGTGRSSLEYLQRVPSGELKIDRKFIIGMSSSENIAAIVKATIQMARAFGKTVVAEGVEDEITMERLRKMDCDLVQGYLIAPAMPIGELIEMLGRTRRVA